MKRFSGYKLDSFANDLLMPNLASHLSFYFKSTCLSRVHLCNRTERVIFLCLESVCFFQADYPFLCFDEKF